MPKKYQANCQKNVNKIRREKINNKFTHSQKKIQQTTEKSKLKEKLNNSEKLSKTKIKDFLLHSSRNGFSVLFVFNRWQHQFQRDAIR